MLGTRTRLVLNTQITEQSTIRKHHMKPKPNPRNIAILIFTVLFAGNGATPAQDTAKPAASRIDVVALRSVPPGNYLVTLQLDGQEQRVNIEVKDESAKCVKSSAPRLNGMQGTFQPIGNGVFTIFFQSESGHRASQFWVFRNDGSAAVKEVPDRGEKQTATPVRDNSIEPAKRP
jgi:hypothetical protein